MRENKSYIIITCTWLRERILLYDAGLWFLQWSRSQCWALLLHYSTCLVVLRAAAVVYVTTISPILYSLHELEWEGCGCFDEPDWLNIEHSIATQPVRNYKCSESCYTNHTLGEIRGLCVMFSCGSFVWLVWRSVLYLLTAVCCTNPRNKSNTLRFNFMSLHVFLVEYLVQKVLI